MFCLDYALAFVSHSILCKFLISSTSSTSSSASSNNNNTLIHFPLGAIAGTTAAIALYPFDIVRMTTVGKGVSHFAFSTIPFMSVYLGMYFIRDVETRKNESFVNKMFWATTATGFAAAAELPFDKAKQNISGGKMKTAAVTTAMRVPLGALLLIAYDQILTNTSSKKKT